MKSIKSPLGRPIGTLLLGFICLAFAPIARSNSADLDPTYLAGVLRYAAERGYLAAGGVQISDDPIEVFYRRESTSPDIGQTIDIQVAIPAWSFELKLRKADYKLTDLGPKVVNKGFVIRSSGELRIEVSGEGWARMQIMLNQIYGSKASTAARPLSQKAKVALLKEALGKNQGNADLSSYKFSALSIFENRLWIYDTLGNQLFELTSDGDLDDELHPPARISKFPLQTFDFGRAAFQRKNTSRDVSTVYGLWACLSNDQP